MRRRPEKELDAALRSSTSAEDPGLEELATVARSLETEMAATPIPAARRERAMFVQGVAARSEHRTPWSLMLPLTATMVLLLGVVYVLGRTAPPGASLWPVHKALTAVGLAPDRVADIDRLITRAESRLELAADSIGASPSAAERYALDAVALLGRARDVLPDLPGSQRAERAGLIAALEQRAIQIILDARAEETPPDDDSSGPGSGDGDDDSSGPGSGDGDEDSSGPGSGDDDSSGPGSGDEDSSGPGSGDEDGDSSGPGSGGGDGSGSGSGGRDSSGPGSGDGDDGSGSSGSGSSGSGSSGSGSGSDSSGSGSGSEN